MTAAVKGGEDFFKMLGVMQLLLLNLKFITNVGRRIFTTNHTNQHELLVTYIVVITIYIVPLFF